MKQKQGMWEHMWNFSSIFLIVITVFAVTSLIVFYFNSKWYRENLPLIRKSFYLLYLVTLTIGFMLEEFSLDNWKVLLQLSGMFVFLDIALFQTPNVTKFLNTELEHGEFIKDAIKQSDETIALTENKVQSFSKVLSESPQYFLTAPQNVSYEEALKSYLSLYTRLYQFKINIFKYIPENRESQDYESQSKIDGNRVFQEIENFYEYKIRDTQKREQIINRLLAGESVQLSGKDTVSEPEFENREPFIVSYFGWEGHYLIGIQSTNHIEVNGIDASHVLNMLQLQEWLVPDEWFQPEEG